jgi:hypothetical protein
MHPAMILLLVALAPANPALKVQVPADSGMLERHVYRSLLPQASDYLLPPDAVAFLDLSAAELEALADVHVDLAFALLGHRPRGGVMPEPPILLDGGLGIYCQGLAPKPALITALIEGMPDRGLERMSPLELLGLMYPMEPGELRWATRTMLRDDAGKPVALDVVLRRLRTPESLLVLAQARIELAAEPVDHRTVFGQRRPAPVFRVIGVVDNT